MFLWGGSDPPPAAERFNPRAAEWWDQYRSALTVSPFALRNLAQSSREIIALMPDPSGSYTGRTSPFRGLVVGAVQSGKTASMIGVTAVALDQGFRIVIVLAGTKDDLREQTARRFNTQLLRQSDPVSGTATVTTMGSPAGPGPLGGFALPYSVDANRYPHLQLKMERALTASEPCVLVVKKNVASLQDTRSVLQWAYRRFGGKTLPTLIIDDECDDASVDTRDTTIPAAIANLWRGRTDCAVVYLGYTATSAANLLQRTTQELYPADFAYLLKYPDDGESMTGFAEPASDSWYCGGKCFYARFGSEPGERDNFLVSPTVTRSDLQGAIADSQSLRDALRAYFVGGAMRLALDPSRSFDLPDRYPMPHAMVVQTSADTGEHEKWGRAIRAIFDGQVLEDRSTSFNLALLENMVTSEEDLWRAWFDRFEVTRERIYNEQPHGGVQRLLSWDVVRARLREVFTHTRLKVVNSDPLSGTALDFNARQTTDGVALPPQDSYVIVVGGAKLSRGLTVEGLCISYFIRWPAAPTEDTVTQLSRWFGYRGAYLEFCRLFTTPEIFSELRGMHENDDDLRRQLAEMMRDHLSPAEAVLVIRSNPRTLPTAKMGDGVLRDVAFSPFNGVFPYLEIGELQQANLDAALQLYLKVEQRGGRIVRTHAGRERGILSSGWSASEVADILESMNYSTHNPPRLTNPIHEYYREPATERPVQASFGLVDDPYQVAAYLRAWSDAARVGRVAEAPPMFNVAISYGDLRHDVEPFSFALSNKMVTPEGRVVGGWTGRSSHWQGDAYFDDPPQELRIPNSYSRARGADGLLVMYVIHRDATGRNGQGSTRQHHGPIFGISIPDGGPPFRRTLRIPR